MPTEEVVPLAIVHDYLTRRGGAERVVAAFARAFPDAPIHTSLFDPSTTFEEFGHLDVRPGVLNRVGLLRRHYRLALPLLAPWFMAQRIDAEVVLASSSGWAHEVRTDGRLVVYCHTPARWLYQTDRYVGAGSSAMRAFAMQMALGVLARPLRAADRRGATRAATYIANSTATARHVGELYGIDAEVLCPPPAVTADGERRAVDGLDDGFVLCVSRLLAYKHVDVVIEAARSMPARTVVIVGDGPELRALRDAAPPNAILLGGVDDATLRWCYAHASVLVAIAYEDFGLTPLEASAFGKPTVARRFGGYLDTVVDGTTGVLLDDATPASVAAAVDRLMAAPPSPDVLRAHAASFSEARFTARLREIVTAT